MDALNTLAGWLIALLQDFQTEGVVDQISFLGLVLGLILAPFAWLLWFNRRTRSAYATENAALRGKLKDTEAANAELVKRAAALEDQAPASVMACFATERRDRNTDRLAAAAEAYLAHHRDCSREACAILTDHYLARYEDGQSGLRRARATALGLLASNPTDTVARDTLDEIEALLRVEAAPPDTAADVRAREEDARLRRVLDDNGNDLTALIAVGDREFDRGFYRRALRIFERAEAVCLTTAGPGPESPVHLSVLYRQARTLAFAGRAAEAETALADLLPIEERVKGKEHPNNLTIRATLAHAQLEQGRAAEAEAALTALLPIEERVQGKEHPETVATHKIHIQSLFEAGRPNDARALFDRIATEIPDNTVSQARHHLLGALCHDSAGDADAAEATLDRAEAAMGPEYGPEHYLRRQIATYRRTRKPGQSGGTTLWMRDRAGDG